MAFSFSTKTTLEGTCKRLIKIILFESVAFLKIGIIYYIKLLCHQFAKEVNELWYLQCICMYVHVHIGLKLHVHVALGLVLSYTPLPSMSPVAQILGSMPSQTPNFQFPFVQFLIFSCLHILHVHV